jgi:histidyl-tRNA synthetase
MDWFEKALIMKVERCRGFRDLSPAEMARFRFVEGVFRDRCLKWGYKEIRTPSLEYIYLFTSAGTLTPGILGRVYSFLDWDGWSGERVVLKPDGTIPAARFYIENIREGLYRLFYVTNIFIFEETGRKSRERWQCGVELMGANSVLSDVELVTLALDVLDRLGQKEVEIKLSHAGLIRALLESLGLSPDEQSRIFDKILDGDVETIARFRPELAEALKILLKLKGKASGFLKNMKALFAKNLSEIKPSLENFIGVVEHLEALGYDYRIDLASGKGFEYYTGMIFHLQVGKEVVGGGGRYDALIPQMGGRDIPAAGFALYIDRLMGLLSPGAESRRAANRILVSIATGAVREGFSVNKLLREAGFAAELSLGGKKDGEYDWLLEVRARGPKFVLTDTVSGRESSVDDPAEVLAMLGCDGNVAGDSFA